MSGPIFVLDAEGTPLMPMSPAHARLLLARGKAARVYHHAFTVIQLTKAVPHPHLRPILAGIALHRTTAELWLISEGTQQPIPLLSLIIDLRTNLPHRLRRRAAHRRRRRARQRYHAPPRHGIPYKLRRPSMHRSGWRKQVKTPARRASNPRLRKAVPPTIQWRARAVYRVISILRNLLPISHVSLLSPHATGDHTGNFTDRAEMRSHLIAAYGHLQPNGIRQPICAYCGATQGDIQVEHLLPQSRGGTNSWVNLVLSCAACNQAKNDRTPAEAGLINNHGSQLLAPSQRARPYRHQTAWALMTELRQSALSCWWHRTNAEPHPFLSNALHQTLIAMREEPATWMAKPIARPRKQRFTARNYPLHTIGSSEFTRVGSTLKRRVRINHGLVVSGSLDQRRPRLATTSDAQADEHVIRIGMLCEGVRAHRPVRGIVTAIHSSGRLTLSHPTQATPAGVIWKRVVISPRSFIRVRATDKVIFFMLNSAE